jgi:acyl dehydratase
MYQETVKRKLGKMIEELKVGDKARFSKKITDRDVHLYMGVTGDMNPIYIDRQYASRTHFEEPIVPGVILAGLIVALISNELPGKGSITVSQCVEYLAPVRWNDLVSTEVEIISIDQVKNRVVMNAVSKNQRGEIVVKGETTVLPPIRLRSAMSFAFEDYN